ncbi:MAG: cytidylate kinase, partial [Spirochaetaceae bacterium]
MSSKSIIAISGRSGCGNSSVSRIVAEKLGFRFVNYTFHDMAKEMNIPFEDLLARARTETSYDLALDKKQVEIAMQGKCVLGSRLAIWLLKEHAVTIYLDGTPEVRGTRIANREKKDPGQAIAETVKRDMFDHERFMKLYKIDNDNFSFADLVIN